VVQTGSYAFKIIGGNERRSEVHERQLIGLQNLETGLPASKRNWLGLFVAGGSEDNPFLWVSKERPGN